MNEFLDDMDGDLLLQLHFGNISNNSVLIQPAKLLTPSEFLEFPYSKPYPQQLELMRSVYQTLEQNRCGLFESPTGTGKSVSLLTASLKWLVDHNERQIRYLNQLKHMFNEKTNFVDDPDQDWIASFDRVRLIKKQIDPQIKQLNDFENDLDKINLIKRTDFNSMLIDMNKKTFKHNDLSNSLASSNPGQQDITESDEYLLDELEDVVDENDDKEEEDESKCPQSKSSNILQIIYCSRTHSQLDQVLKEFGKLEELNQFISVLHLASRSSLCTNPDVFKLKHPDLINHACMDLARKSKRCPKRSNPKLLEHLSHFMLNGNSALHVAETIRSSNNLTTNSSSTVGCPYYANRRNLGLAQLILVPYSILLNPSIRMACGLDLEGSIVILDEAHNLLEATAQTLSASLNLFDLKMARQLFHAYVHHYRSRLAPMFLLRLDQLGQVVRRIHDYLAKIVSTDGNQLVLTLVKLISLTNLDNFNLASLVEFLQNGHFVVKLMGFGRWYSSRRNQAGLDEPRSGLGGILDGMKRKSMSLNEVMRCLGYCIY